MRVSCIPADCNVETIEKCSKIKASTNPISLQMELHGQHSQFLGIICLSTLRHKVDFEKSTQINWFSQIQNAANSTSKCCGLQLLCYALTFATIKMNHLYDILQALSFDKYIVSLTLHLTFVLRNM